MKKNKKKILITGGAGYIGQNLTSFFIKEKYQIFVIDNLSTSKSISREIKKKISFYKIDLTKEKKVKAFFEKNDFDLIIHLAAFSGVQEFNKDVLSSFNNNILATINLINFGFKKKTTKLIFASSAAVYGKVSRTKISENKICDPANYYGLSKYVCENLIENQFKNQRIHYAILRYFNVVGSITKYQAPKKTESLLDIVRSKINKNKYQININGKKLRTKDGTPERDFIHISDLCRIHKKTYSYLKKNRQVILNCGSGTRYSVSEIISAFEKFVNRKFKISYKITNIDETQTICSDIGSLRRLLKMDIKKNKIYDLVRDYL